MTSSNGNIFRVTGPLCGEFTGPGEFPAQRPVTRSFDVFFDLPLNKRLSKQPWGWWFETPAWSLWRHRNVQHVFIVYLPLSSANRKKSETDLRSNTIYMFEQNGKEFDVSVDSLLSVILLLIILVELLMICTWSVHFNFIVILVVLWLLFFFTEVNVYIYVKVYFGNRTVRCIAAFKFGTVVAIRPKMGFARTVRV